jgi:hypothetical protein
MTTKNVTIVFTQEGEHVYSWETDTSGLSIEQMAEAACSGGLVDEELPLEFIVYNDDSPEGVEQVIFKGTIEPGYWEGSDQEPAVVPKSQQQLDDKNVNSFVAIWSRFRHHESKILALCETASKDREQNTISPNAYPNHEMFDASLDAILQGTIEEQLKYLMVHGHSGQYIYSQAGVLAVNP